jgi:hypothetical protein
LTAELTEKCDLITQKLQQYVIGRKGNSTDTEAFFQKTVADFYRYVCECLPKNEEKKKETYKANSLKFYKKAYELSTVGLGFKKALDPCNLTKLSINLHYGNFIYEILGNGEEAAGMCEKAVTDCMASIDQIQEDKFAETSNLCELLKENILLWKGDKTTFGGPP